MSVVIETTLGDITVDLYLSERPRACLNFLKLCKIKYYNYHLFHTISRGFIAQTGDPTGSRSGGESLYGVLDGSSKRYFEGENEPRIKHTKMGLISFVGNEEKMIGSQFFITLGEDLTYLDQKHCVFGEVVEGYDVLEELNEVICDTDDRPYQDVRITHTVILDDPYPDPRKLTVPSRSPSPSAERLQGGRIAPDEEIDETEGKTAQEVAEVQADREAKARATILEMVGDLPDAEMAPPENVLFVCKLNPVTTDDDLEIIFNRFGKIVSCEVIRDRKTGDSLQYAFIEFSDRKACEDAYFKMDNILIDDRRIHVDFSQSVSKVKWLGKGRGVAHFDEKGRRTTNPNNSVGKGNYKVNIRDNPNGRHDLPNKDKETNSSSQRNRNNKSPLEEADQENNSSRYKDRRDRSYDNKSNYRESSSRSLKRNSPQRIYSREDENRDRRRNNRDRSRSPRRNEDFRNWRNMSNRQRGHKSPSKRADDSRRYSRDMYGSNREYQSRRQYQNDERNRRNSRSRNNDKRTDRDRDSRYHRSNPSSSKTSERNPRKNDDSEDDRKSKDHKRKNTKEIKAKTESESSESEIEKRKEKQKSRKKNGVDRKDKNDKKYRKKKIESDSDSESSDSDSDEPKSKKAKIKLSNKKTEKRKVSSSDSSETSDTSDSSDSSDSVSSSESEKDKKKKKRRKNRKDDSSSDSSKSDVNEKKKRRRRKK